MQQQQPSVAYPGRDGAHSAAACDRLFPNGADLRPLPSFTAVAEATAAGAVAFGSSRSRARSRAPSRRLTICSTTLRSRSPARRCSLSATASSAPPRSRWRRSASSALTRPPSTSAGACWPRMPEATAIAAATTTDAAAQVAAHADPTEVAIASERAARLHGLAVIAGDVGDHPEAYTRFVSVATHVRLDRGGERWRTAFSFITDHQPGALHRAIGPFAGHGIDLVQLVSRPIPHSPWRYRFDAVLDGHPLDHDVRETLAEVGARARHLRVFGSYPADTSLA